MPLHYAAQQGSIEVVTALLAAGATVNERDRLYSYTPLFLAARKYHFAAVQELLLAEANANLDNYSSWTPLLLAAQPPQSEVEKKHRQIKTIQILFERGAHAIIPVQQIQWVSSETVALINNHAPLIAPRARIIHNCLTSNGLPRDLIRLFWEIAGLPLEHKPKPSS